MVCGEQDEFTAKTKGPASVIATLLVQTGDDSGHESHMCVICISIGSPGVPKDGECNVSYSDGEWDRPLSARIDGYSQDGKHILGLSSEGGKGPATEVFDFDTQPAPDPTDEADIAPYLKRLRHAKCGISIDIAGTRKDGLVVLEPTTTDPCQSKYRSILNVKTAKLKGLLPAEAFIPLYVARGP